MLWFFGNSKKSEFDRSPKWKTIRSQHLKSNSYCAACGRKTGLEVHHIEPVQINPQRELDPTNLITLCDSYCHLAIGHLMDYKSWNENVIKDSEVYLDKVQNRPSKNRD
jgi:5-methylcytosine-specific restriction endonuclease McrA